MPVAQCSWPVPLELTRGTGTALPTVEIDRTLPDTMSRIEVLNVPLSPDGRLDLDYFVGIGIGSGVTHPSSP